MLVELAIGDAYGAGFEYAPREKIDSKKDKWKYVEHGKYKLGLGNYTDDTQMSLAIAELLIEENEWTPLNIANKFVEVFKRDPREGYASKFYDFLTDVKSGTEFLEKIRPSSVRSGAAMRASPLGYLESTEKVKQYAEIQSKLTHDTPGGILSGQASALMAHYFIYSLGPKEDLLKFVNKNLRTDWVNWGGSEVDGSGVSCVRAAITSIQKNKTLGEILLNAIDMGGDVDTVAAIAIGAASNSKNIPNDFVPKLYSGLENGKYGRDYLEVLDNKLKDKFLK